MEIDVLLDVPFSFETAHGARKAVHLPEGEVAVLSRGDIISMKARSDREQDRADIRALRSLEALEEDQGE